MSTATEWVVVRQTISNGRKWFLAVAGQYCTENPKKAQTYRTREDAEHVVALERRDLERGRGRGGFRVWAEERPA